eukprot:GEMP01024706.1.p1 GENE.GEMP01024706.1~~GEMP01024706.1.p1  ORF type:complete len:635 (+),score=182.74 GEMP01024706.1:156-2060(+)
MRSGVNVELERRMQEVERQTELLVDRTTFLDGQTANFRKSLWKEAKRHEESLQSVVGGVTEVRYSVEETLGRELGAFRTVADEKLNELAVAFSKLQELDKLVRGDAEREIRHALSYTAQNAEENEKWRAQVHQDIREEFRELGRSFNEKIDDSTAKVDEQFSSVRRRITKNIDEVNKREIEEGCEREVEIQSLQFQLSEIRQDQREFGSRLTALLLRLEIWEKQDKSKIQRVEQVRVELLEALGSVEEASQIQHKVAADTTKDLGADLRKQLEQQSRELDVVSAMAEHWKLQCRDEFENLRRMIKHEISRVENAQSKNLTTMSQQHDAQIAELQQLIMDEKTERQEQVDELRLRTQKNERDIRNIEESMGKNQVLYQKELDTLHEVMEAEDRKNADALGTLRELTGVHSTQMGQQLEIMEGAQQAMNRDLERVGHALDNEQDARVKEVVKLAERVDAACPSDEFVEFRKRTAAKDKKNEILVDDLHRKLADLAGRIEETSQSATKAEQDIADFTDTFEKHNEECDVPKIFGVLQAEIALLERKLSKSPLLERILRPLPKSSTPRPPVRSRSFTSSKTSPDLTPKVSIGGAPLDTTPTKVSLRRAMTEQWNSAQVTSKTRLAERQDHGPSMYSRS